MYKLADEVQLGAMLAAFSAAAAYILIILQLFSRPIRLASPRGLLLMNAARIRPAVASSSGALAAPKSEQLHASEL